MAYVTVNLDKKATFLSALLDKLAGPQTRAAFWFDTPAALPVAADPIPASGASPFAGSGSILAGEGYVLPLTGGNSAKLAVFFAEDAPAAAALLHIEVESAGQIQFRGYDGLNVIILGPALDSGWISALERRDLVRID